MASQPEKKIRQARSESGFLLRLKALQELNKNLPLEFRVAINKSQINTNRQHDESPSLPLSE